MLNNIFFSIALFYLTRTVYCVELTFELADNAKECFYEEIKANQTASLEFQVMLQSTKLYRYHSSDIKAKLMMPYT